MEFKEDAGCEISIPTLATVVKEKEGGWGRKGPLTEEVGRLSVRYAPFIPGTVSGIFTGLNEGPPYFTLAAVILHPIHSSSLF